MLCSWWHFSFCHVEQSPSGRHFPASVTEMLHRTLDLIQSSLLVLQKRSLRARETKAAQLWVAELGHPGPLMPSSHRSWPLWASLLACLTPPHPQGQPQGHLRGQSQESGPLASSGWGEGQGECSGHFPVTWLNAAPGRTRLSVGTRTGQSSQDRVPSRSTSDNPAS